MDETPAATGTDAWLALLARIPGAGALVREPALDAASLRDLAVRAAAVAPLVVLHAKNPHAAAVAADLGVPVHGPVGSFGVSCHDEADVDAAFAAGAAYALLSPVWRPTSKPGDARAPLGPDRFVAIAAGRPVYALGGVTPERHARLLARGAHGSAVLGGLAAFVGPVRR